MPLISFVILFLLGIIAGMVVALPYGPVGFVTIRRFYLFGMKSGLYSSLGMALSDGCYAAAVGFGLHGILHFVSRFALVGEVFLGILLIIIGIRSMSQKLELQIDEEEKHPTRDIASTFFINILNPSLVFWFALAFEIFRNITHHPISKIQTGIAVVGIIAGAWFLWFLIGTGICYLRRKNKSNLVEKINYITGGIITTIGVVICIITIIKFI
jgi:threonine/homoserine/homoserine lactone efflux protein